MTYSEVLALLRDYILVSELMFAMTLLLMSSTVFVAIRTRVWGLLIMAGGTLGVTVYYFFSVFHLWSSSVEGHVYGRTAFLVLYISLFVSMRMLYKRNVTQ